MKRVAALNNFGLLSRSLRTAAGFTIADQATKLCIAPADIANFEMNIQTVPVNYVRAFAYWLRVDPETQTELERLAKKPARTEIIPGLSSNQSRFLEKQLRKVSDFSPMLISGLHSFLEEGLRNAR